MRTAVPLTALMSGSLLNFSAGAVDQSAPFGFSWGPVDKVPQSSLATRESNVTQLPCFRDRLPLNEPRNAEEIILEVCKNEGLQQIVGLAVLFPPLRSTTKVAVGQTAAAHDLCSGLSPYLKRHHM